MTEILTDTKLNKLFGTEFELINHGFRTAEYNMDFDYKRMLGVFENKELPMFRLYSWKPWGLSLGAHQKEGEIDPELCKKKGFDIVRRPTGGRAVLHADEITYSVVMKVPDGMTVHDLYREIHIVLMEGLNSLGCTLEFEKSQPNFREFYKESGMSVSCFASSARYEIAHEGRKIVGSAQRLYGDTLLQHGSILLGPGHEQLADIANTENESKREVLRRYILSHSATIEDVTGKKISYDAAADAIINAVKR